MVAAFLNSQLNHDGGFNDRSGKSDLYYTVFGIESLIALTIDLPREPLAEFLNTFGDGQSLDLVHAASLARCLADLSENIPEPLRHGIIQNIARHRTPDGGFSETPDSEHASMYSCFLALGAYQDTRTDIPDPDKLLTCVNALKTHNGGYANNFSANNPVPTVPATAAALAILTELNATADPASAQWMLEKCYVHGGFKAAPNSPIPDLLSTATALHALSAVGADIDHIKQPCLDFINSLWDPKGSFAANFADDALDCEYTYYGLLSIGHLSELP